MCGIVGIVRFNGQSVRADAPPPAAQARNAARAPPEAGFEIPVDRWFREPTTEDLRAQLKDGALVHGLGFNKRAVERLLGRHLGGEDIRRKLFALTALERWARRYA